MSEITRVGADLAKRVIQVHAVDAVGKLVTNRALPRDKFIAWCAQLPAGCLVAMEASSSAHHWARRLVALGLDARVIAAHLVAPYRLQGKGGKNDANDAAAICEAASRPQMRFVPIKTVEQQSMLCVHRLREGLKTDRTACVNRIRGLLAEFGLVFGKSAKVLREVLSDVLEDANNELAGLARGLEHKQERAWAMAPEPNASTEPGTASKIVSSNGAIRTGTGQGSMSTTKFQGAAGYVTGMSGGVGGRGCEVSSYPE